MTGYNEFGAVQRKTAPPSGCGCTFALMIAFLVALAALLYVMLG
jgi:hypothetical protein